MAAGTKKTYRTWRRACQILCFLIFVFLFIKTDYSGQDEIRYAVNILFRIDPLLAVSAMLAARTFIALMLPALITVALTLLLGRAFCGWACPMGGLLDASHHILPARHQHLPSKYRPLKYYLLTFLLIGAFFGLPVAGYFDPFSILVRSLALSLYPAFNEAVTGFFTFTYLSAPDWVNFFTEPVYAFLKQTVLPFHQHFFDLALLSLAILCLVFLLEQVERRFFCRNLCPLGGLLSVISKYSLLRGHGGDSCGKCKQCHKICRMAAIDDSKNISQIDCTLCMDCVDVCPGKKISFRFARSQQTGIGFSITRRTFITSASAGVVLPFFLQTRTMAARPDPTLVRPPGALEEEEFVGRCVRCGECMKVCIGNGLQPTFLTAGIEGIFTPRLKSRTGYCEYNCTLCGQVCPTGAIRTLTLQEKQKTKIGNAWFDKNRCLPYAKGVPCIVCEEHCPTPDKAIKFRNMLIINSKGEEAEVRQPYLVDSLCIGCGICEHKCPLPGDAAVHLTSGGESRDPEKALFLP